MIVDWDSFKSKYPYLEHSLANALNKPYFNFVVTGGNTSVTNKEQNYNLCTTGCYVINEVLGNVTAINSMIAVSSDLFWITCHGLGELSNKGTTVERFYEEIIVIYGFNAWITNLDLGYSKLSGILGLPVDKVKEIFENFCKRYEKHPTHLLIH